MKKAIAILLLLSMLLSLCACAPAEKPEEQPGKVPDTAEPVTPGPAPATPDPEPTKPDPQPVTTDPEPTKPDPQPVTPDPQPVTPDPEQTKKNPEEKYNDYLSSPVSVPESFQPEIAAAERAPESADGLFFSCRNANIHAPADATLNYTFYVVSTRPIMQDEFNVDSGLEAQQSYTFNEVTLLGYKEKSTGTAIAQPEHNLAASTEDWRTYAWLWNNVLEAKTDAARYVEYSRFCEVVRKQMEESEKGMVQWLRKLPAIFAYSVVVRLVGTSKGESTDTFTVTVKGKSYRVNCGIIRLDADIPTPGSALLSTGGVIKGQVGITDDGHLRVKRSNYPLAVFQARENITVMGVEIRSSSDISVQNALLTIKDTEGMVTNFVMQTADAFSLKNGDELQVDCELYDQLATTANCYEAYFTLIIRYKTTSGKTECAVKSLHFAKQVNVYRLFLEEIRGVNFQAYYDYVYFPINSNKFEKYGIVMPSELYKYKYIYEYFGT